ncbi:Peripheral-type benzodiazepine receptor-associated protein 1 [Merluccius polli]|uniref:Peripheral-type benzodiazepine receptor-associated protein 1 n=1 Tax=Merluccius polli TaxID=89951 RepID=A0AA47P157_MERPO|nr:Peripheral-type benzodiazepine receptor-associated protein 1 [Merluccius polli]
MTAAAELDSTFGTPECRVQLRCCTASPPTGCLNELNAIRSIENAKSIFPVILMKWKLDSIFLAVKLFYPPSPCCAQQRSCTSGLHFNVQGPGLPNGTDYGFLVRQNSELLRALEELEKTCTALKDENGLLVRLSITEAFWVVKDEKGLLVRLSITEAFWVVKDENSLLVRVSITEAFWVVKDENGLLRKSSAPETEEKVRRLRRKNTELAVLAKRLEERARKLQEANLRVVNSPSLLRPGSVEQYKRAFARQRARDLAHHADTLLSKDKEIASLQNECRDLEAQLCTTKGTHPVPSGRLEFERLLRESQKEVLRLQRQLSVTSSSKEQQDPGPTGPPDGHPGLYGPPDPAGADGGDGHVGSNGVNGPDGVDGPDVSEKAMENHPEQQDEEGLQQCAYGIQGLAEWKLNLL